MRNVFDPTPTHPQPPPPNPCTFHSQPPRRPEKFTTVVSQPRVRIPQQNRVRPRRYLPRSSNPTNFPPLWLSICLFLHQQLAKKSTSAVRRKGESDAYCTLNFFRPPLTWNRRNPQRYPRASGRWRIHSCWSSRPARLRATHLPRCRLPVGSRLLGLRTGWLLLGSRCVG